MTARSRTHIRPTLLAWLTALALAAGAHAGAPPVVEFNADYVVRCRDVTSGQCRCKDRKLVEATFRISALIASGKEADLDHCLYTVYDGKRLKKLYVLDYLPKTEVRADVTDPIVVIESKATETNLSGAITAGYQFVTGSELRAGRKDQVASTVEYRKLPPLKLLVASGITERGYGVFCKLKPTDQATVEGDRLFSCIFCVPRSWRGDYLNVKCRATATQRGVAGLFDEKVDAGAARFALGLYLDGDAETEGLVRRLAQVQQEILDEVARREAESGPEFLRKLESSVGLRGGTCSCRACLFNWKVMERAEVDGQALQALPESLRSKYEEAADIQRRLESCSGR